MGEEVVDRTAIILAGGFEGPELDRGLIQLNNKPIITYVVNSVKNIVDEIVICLSDETRISMYSKVLPDICRIVIDDESFPGCPLRGAYTGLLNAKGKYSALLACDMPFISAQVIDMLFDIAIRVNAVVPRWPDGNIEPLHAVYRTEPALKAAKMALERGEYSMRAMVSLLRGVRYISTLVIKEMDPKMRTLINVNAQADLRRAEALIRRASGGTG